MGYNKKMANGESLIIFIRKKEDPDTPFITMEYNPKSKKINQLYGDHDKQPNKEIQKIIYNQWLPTIKTIKSTRRLTT